jgi:hypothetical protein
VELHYNIASVHVLTNPTVHEASEQDTDNAVAAAKAAFPGWSELTPEKRGSYFKKLANLIRENNDELAALEASSISLTHMRLRQNGIAMRKLATVCRVGHMIMRCKASIMTCNRHDWRSDSRLHQHDLTPTIRCGGWNHSVERTTVVSSEQASTRTDRW